MLLCAVFQGPVTVGGMSHDAWSQFSHTEIHRLLCDLALSSTYRTVAEVGSQALSCPYYVPLAGRLGADWGVIVNPASSRFGLLTFEHDDCGCPAESTEDDAGWGRHEGAPSQDGDMWCDEWVHVCDPAWCDQPCDWAPPAGLNG